MTERVSEEAQRVLDAMTALEEIADPVERTRAIGEVLKRLPAQNQRLSALRGELVVQLLARPGASLRSVGKELNLHWTTVRDIRDGYKGSGRNRPKKKSEAGE